jgi:hypothetical protein
MMEENAAVDAMVAPNDNVNLTSANLSSSQIQACCYYEGVDL